MMFSNVQSYITVSVCCYLTVSAVQQVISLLIRDVFWLTEHPVSRDHPLLPLLWPLLLPPADRKQLSAGEAACYDRAEDRWACLRLAERMPIGRRIAVLLLLLLLLLLAAGTEAQSGDTDTGKNIWSHIFIPSCTGERTRTQKLQ